MHFGRVHIPTYFSRNARLGPENETGKPRPIFQLQPTIGGFHV